tara:strand:+ start:3293 stop:3517 length:225 start_codon:yes stop_codon:yes gene_type:complete
MTDPEKFIKIFTGNTIEILALRNELQKKEIVPIIKDDSESDRLSGFGVVVPGLQEVFVHKDELDVAIRMVESLK